MPRPLDYLLERLLPKREQTPTALRRTTRSVPSELLARLKLRPYDQQLVDTFLPNRLAREKGWGIFDDMLGDAQVAANSTIKRYAPISNGWQVVPPNNTRPAAEIAQFCRDCLGDFEHTVEEACGEVLISTFTGMTISELLFRYESSGMYRGKIMLKDIQTRPPSVVDVSLDESGDVRGVISATSGNGWADEVLLPKWKFIIHTWHGRYGSPYGRGDGIAVYKHWWNKDFLLRAWAIYMDRFGAPAMWGQESPDMSNEDYARFEKMLEDFQHEGWILTPPDWKIEFIQAPGGANNGDAFRSAIEWHDTQIAKAILGSSLSTDQPVTGLGLGGAGVAATHADTRDLLLTQVKRAAETSIMTRQVLRRLVILNYGLDAARQHTPRMIFNPPDLEQMSALADILTKLAQGGFIDPTEPWIRERLHLPSREEVQTDVQAAELEDAEHKKKVNEALGFAPNGQPVTEGEDS